MKHYRTGRRYDEKWIVVNLDAYLPSRPVRSSLGRKGEVFDCRSFFATTGCAVVKAVQLYQEMRDAALALDPALVLGDFTRAIGGVARLKDHLVGLRGTHLWLETDWRDRQFCVCPKSPRPAEVTERMKRKGWTI